MQLRKFLYTALPVTALIVSGCSTRQVVDHLSGSTEQRLITYSLEKMIQQLPVDDFAAYKGKKAFITSHFIKNDAMLTYADTLLKAELHRQYEIVIAGSKQDAEIELEFFFQSMGTDSDVFGLSIPLVNVTDGTQNSRLDILAVNMYHGISECRYYIRDLTNNNRVIATNKVLARIRTDNVSTPIFSFPLSHL